MLDALGLSERASMNPENKTKKKQVKDHVDIGEGVGGVDFAAGSKISGARFVSLKSCVFINVI